MKKSQFTEEQIIAILREQEAGVATAEVCRRHGVGSATFYKWKAKFGGLDVSEARRLKGLEDENGRLKLACVQQVARFKSNAWWACRRRLRWPAKRVGVA
ncbi:transposase, partial [Aureimonas phyllosphaerae]